MSKYTAWLLILISSLIIILINVLKYLGMKS